MPPKAKFTEESIINAALSIIEQNGIKALTARSLGDELNSSARPIFTVFSGMDEVVNCATAAANNIYRSYVENGLRQSIPFKGVGQSYIKFAAEHPKLFQLLFMNERKEVPDLLSVLGVIESSYDKIVQSIVASYNIDKQSAIELYQHMWIYTHGIATLIATNVCEFTQEQISDMLTVVFSGLIIKIKKDNKL